MPETAVDVLKEIIFRRRDVRAEFTGKPASDSEIAALLEAAHAAPSVGNSQPWDFVVIRHTQTLARFAEHVQGCRQRYAESLSGDRRTQFDPIKIEGICESGLGIVVTYDPDRSGPNVLGRHTVDEAGVFSAVCAVQNLWLMATAMGLGVGWVSFYQEHFLTQLLDIPHRVRPVAWLCVGQVATVQQVPDLIRFGWNQRIDLAELTHHERW